MTDIDHTAGDTARDKRPTALKGLFFFIILLLVCGGLVLAATQLRSKEGPKVATVAPEPMAVQVAPVELTTAFTLNETYSGLAEARRNSALAFPLVAVSRPLPLMWATASSGAAFWQASTRAACAPSSRLPPLWSKRRALRTLSP